MVHAKTVRLARCQTFWRKDTIDNTWHFTAKIPVPPRFEYLLRTWRNGCHLIDWRQRKYIGELLIYCVWMTGDIEFRGSGALRVMIRPSTRAPLVGDRLKFWRDIWSLRNTMSEGRRNTTHRGTPLQLRVPVRQPAFGACRACANQTSTKAAKPAIAGVRRG